MRNAPPWSARKPAGSGLSPPRCRSARRSSRARQARGASLPRRAASASSRSAVAPGGISAAGPPGTTWKASGHSRPSSATRSFWTRARLRNSPGSRRRSYSSSAVPRISLNPPLRSAKRAPPPSQFDGRTASDRAGRDGSVPSGSSSAVRLVPSIGRGAASFRRSRSVGARSKSRTGSGIDRSRTASPGTRSRTGTRKVASYSPTPPPCSPCSPRPTPWLEATATMVREETPSDARRCSSRPMPASTLSTSAS